MCQHALRSYNRRFRKEDVNITSTHTRSIPTPRPSTTSRYYRPELDVLRLIAFLSVFLV
jgi:hypothetical protein